MGRVTSAYFLCPREGPRFITARAGSVSRSVTLETEITNHQLVLWEDLVQLGLEDSVIQHLCTQTVADKHNPGAGLNVIEDGRSPCRSCSAQRAAE